MLLQQDGVDGAETGESLEALGPASLALAAVNKKETPSQDKGKVSLTPEVDL